MPNHEYPRPQLKRDQWMSLNGTWGFSFDDFNQGHQEQWFQQNHIFKETIEVPFVFQTKASGIHDLTPHDHLWYQRKFLVPDDWKERIILHFEAVDYLCEVYLNGRLLGENQGGYHRFSFDITDVLQKGEQVLSVYVFDPTYEERILRGKQAWTKDHHSIWYPRSSGIWQTVWLENISQHAISAVKMTPHIDEGLLDLLVQTKSNIRKILRVIILDNNEVIAQDDYLMNDHIKRTIQIWQNKIFQTNFHEHGKTWSPEHPFLYTIKFEVLIGNQVIDQVESYFGMRKVHTENGMVYLNNKPYYLKLVLDQGYYHDSLLTAPNDDAFITDISLAKGMGFNGCRKHQKIESERFLYHADHMGYLVWGELPSAAAFDSALIAQTQLEWSKMIERDYNHPSIVAWVPLNESWGVPMIGSSKIEQNYALSLYHLTKALDPTRIVISNDGWEQVGGDICAIHHYNHGDVDDLTKQLAFKESLRTKANLLNAMPANRKIYANGFAYEGQPIILTEFGGISFTKGIKNGWGYSHVNDNSIFLKEYERLISAVKESESLAGFCYTQFSDVEQEINGLVNYDRSLKVSLEELKKINDSVSFMVNKIK